MSLGYWLAPSTPFTGVFKLAPAHTLHVKDGRLTTRRYWDVTRFDSDQRGENALLDAVDETLGAAVRDRLESEVPLGAFLSGGIDSGLIVSYMAEALGDRLVTTTVGFAEAAHNELAAARLTAAHVKALHHEHLIEPSLDEVLDPATIGCGEPMADSSAIPTWYVSRAARSHVTVALSGDGGDETFAGYDFRYVPHVLESRARRLVPGAAGRRLARWTGRAWPRGPRVPSPLRAGTLLDNLSRDAASAFYVDLCFLKPAPTRALMGLDPGDERDSAAYAAVTDVYRRCPSGEPLTRAQYTDLHVYMPNDPLVKVDRMSMAHGLEVRSPLLDRRVVELAFAHAAPAEATRQDGQVDPARAGEAAAAGGPGDDAETWLHCAGRKLDRRPLCRSIRGRGPDVIDAHRNPRRSLGPARLVRRASCRPRRPQLRALGHVGPRALAAERRRDRRDAGRCGGDAVIVGALCLAGVGLGWQVGVMHQG